MRLDRYLFFIRLLKTRTQAQELLHQGRTRIDGRRVEKVSEIVRVGATITLPLRGAIRVIRVLSLPARRGPSPEARACYEELGVDDGDRAA
ncbi:S4 domain-containing protein [Sphingomonas kaistensis]|uniref:S4 domain-containing protein n=1 Tax=Sphingomonas kaistensis TaxID=298708 RepID=A0ABZ2G1M2_9SPHN